MLLLKKLNQEGFDFNKLPDDLQQATDVVLNSNDEPQKIQMLDLVTYKSIRKLYKKEVENTITDISFKNMPGNDGFNTRVLDNSFAAGGTTETRYQIKNKDGEYYSRLGGAEHFNPVPEFGLFYNDEEAEDVKEYLEKKGYKNLQIVPYVPQHEHAYKNGGILSVSAEKQFNPDYYAIFVNGDKVDTHFIYRERATWLDSSSKYSFVVVDKENKKESKPFKTLDEALAEFKSNYQKHSYAAGGPIQTSNIVLFGSSPVEIVGIGRSKAEVKDSKGNRYNVSISSLKEAPQYVINKFIETAYKPEYWHSKQQYDAGKNFAAGGPIETPQQLGSALKAYFKKKYNLDILTRYIKTVRGLDGSWYEISSFRSGQIIPNEVRLEILRRFRPDAVPASGLEDIHYGNISSQRISLYGREWKEFLQAQEGKMAKGGPTMGDIIKANKDRIILARPAAAISDKQMDMKEFTDLIKKIKWFTPGHQLDYLGNLFRSEEKDGAIEIAKRLAGIIDKMPKVYETEDTETNDKILYLHYFYAGSDWYIIEKDTSTEQHQAFGYAILNGDTEMAEWGYISLEEFRSSKKIELDFYFTPIKFGDLKKRWEERKEESKPEVYQRPRQGTFLYGKRWDVPEMHSTELLQILSEKGFSIVKKNGPSVDLSKDGHTFYVNDNGGELNLGDVKTKEHIANIPYSITTGIRKPAILASDIQASFEEYYKEPHHSDFKVVGADVIKFKDKDTGDKILNETPPLYVSYSVSWIGPGYTKTLIGQDLPAGWYATQNTGKLPHKPLTLATLMNYKTGQAQGRTNIAQIPDTPAVNIVSGNKPQNSELQTKNYANAYELNKAIEKLLDSKPNDADFTADEKAFLKYYSGYGGLEKFGATGKGLLYEYYTPALIAEKMWGLAYKYGFSGGPVLEPSAGIGEFIKYAPEQNLVVAHEINTYSARICKILYPLITISTQYFEQIFIKNNDSIKGKIGLLPKYKLVIGNPPYGEFGGKWAGMGEKNYTRAGNYIDYFIFRGLDLLDPGGLLVFIVGAEVASGGKCFLSQQMNKCKDEIMEKSDLLDAYRLPNGVFERTDVLSDIIVLRKK